MFEIHGRTLVYTLLISLVLTIIAYSSISLEPSTSWRSITASSSSSPPSSTSSTSSSSAINPKQEIGADVLCPSQSCFGDTPQAPVFVSKFFKNIEMEKCYFKYDLNKQVETCKQTCQKNGVSSVIESLVPSSSFSNHTIDKKYEGRAKEGYCEKQGMWAGHHTGYTSCPVMFAGSVFGYKAGNLVFDWGSGCGHQATWMAGMFGVHVLGIDLADTGVAWARNHSMGKFFAGNGMHLDWIPDNTFDHAYSYAAIYHLNSDFGKSQCLVYEQLLRIIKPGGTIFDGWKPHHGWFRGPYTQKMLLECFGSMKGVSYNLYNETDLYGGVGTDMPGGVLIARKVAGGLSDVVGNLRTVPNMVSKRKE